MTDRERARYRLIRSWTSGYTAREAFREARRYCEISDEEHARRDAAWRAEIDAKMAAARTSQHRDKWEEHSEPATDEQWNAYANETWRISRADYDRAYREGRLRFEYIVLPPTIEDPDCFEPDGDPRAADRWSDDGGRP